MDGVKLVKVRQSLEAPVVSEPGELVFEQTARVLSEGVDLTEGLRGNVTGVGLAVRLAVIEDTLHPEELWLSEAAAEEAVGGSSPLVFDPGGALRL